MKFYYLNVLNKKAGKVFGIKKILEITGLKKNQVIVIGDNGNDLGIISFAGIGIAMANASKIIREAADFVVSENDKDEVTEAIYKYVKF